MTTDYTLPPFFYYFHEDPIIAVAGHQRSMVIGSINAWGRRQSGTWMDSQKIDAPNMGAAVVMAEPKALIVVWCDAVGQPVKMRPLRMEGMKDWVQVEPHRVADRLMRMVGTIREAALEDCRERSWWQNRGVILKPETEGAKEDLKRWEAARRSGVDPYKEDPKFGKAPFTNLDAPNTCIRVRTR